MSSTMNDTAWTPGRLVVGKPCATGFMVEIEEEESPGRSYVVGRASPKYAAMFAAAPELYAALERLVNAYESDSDLHNPDSWHAARLALAKAKGGV